MKKIVVIPARGGSKGIPQKNIYPVNGKPLIEYTLDMLSRTALSDMDVVVSTDSDKIKAVVEKYQNVMIVDRPEDISGDEATTEAALLHALDVMDKKFGKKYDAVLTLQATSPLRLPETLMSFVEHFEATYPSYDAQLSLNENRADFWITTGNDQYERLYKDAPRRRQERTPLYIENSAYYITSVEALRKTKSVLGTRVNGFVISDVEAVDINEPLDIVIAESLLRQREDI
ncbi:MAG: acylneuraminate cytidylyltransferase family protein [Lachnospiraceae bacterium]|nr:acylneuraminate cytidylyltransferase family protein [Lachnospiraceae bacterium]